MNASDYGGGTPVVDVWAGATSASPSAMSKLPEARGAAAHDDGGRCARRGRMRSSRHHLQPGKSFSTFQTFVAVHRGDYFAALDAYRRLLRRARHGASEGAGGSLCARSGAPGAMSAASPSMRW